VVIPVLANDTDSDGDPLTVASATQTANGAVVLNTNNTVSYTPNAGFSGTDTFTYTASDGRGGTATGTVTVTVSSIIRISVASGGAEGNGTSGGTSGNDFSLSADGRYVVFRSDAWNLAPSGTNGISDIFVHDLHTGETERVSVAADGTPGDSSSYYPSISADGRYMAFGSWATNLVPGSTDGYNFGIFVHDRQTGNNQLVHVASGGTPGNAIQDSFDPQISADGHYVAFESAATNLVSNDTNGFNDIFVYDRQTGAATERASVASNGAEGHGTSYNPVINTDGRYVAFISLASDLVPSDTNGAGDIFVHDRQTGETARISVASDGTQGSAGSVEPSISADGRYVAFASEASTLVTNDNNGTWDVFVHDRQTEETTLISIASDGTQSGNAESSEPSLSGDGRYVAFKSDASDLVSGDNNNGRNIFVRDRQTGKTARVNNVTSDGKPVNNESYNPRISADGRYVAFISAASNLVSGDNNGVTDIFQAINPLYSAAWNDTPSTVAGNAVVIPVLANDRDFQGFP
jgi:Tol biopolymer transport system component